MLLDLRQLLLFLQCWSVFNHFQFTVLLVGFRHFACLDLLFVDEIWLTDHLIIILGLLLVFHLDFILLLVPVLALEAPGARTLFMLSYLSLVDHLHARHHEHHHAIIDNNNNGGVDSERFDRDQR